MFLSSVIKQPHWYKATMKACNVPITFHYQQIKICNHAEVPNITEFQSNESVIHLLQLNDVVTIHVQVPCIISLKTPIKFIIRGIPSA